MDAAWWINGYIAVAVLAGPFFIEFVFLTVARRFARIVLRIMVVVLQGDGPSRGCSCSSPPPDVCVGAKSILYAPLYGARPQQCYCSCCGV